MAKRSLQTPRRFLISLFLLGVGAMMVATYPFNNIPSLNNIVVKVSGMVSVVTNKGASKVMSGLSNLSDLSAQSAQKNTANVSETVATTSKTSLSATSTTTVSVTATTTGAIVKTPTTKPAPQTFEKIFYYAPRYRNSAIESLKENMGKIDIFAPQTFEISANLMASGSVDQEILDIVKTSNGHVRIMPLMANRDFSTDIIHRFLASSTAQDRVINYMIDEATTNGYIGWQYDIEHIYYTDRDAYSKFVEKTAAELKSHNLILSIAAVSRINDSQSDFYKKWSGAFDYERLAKAADFISIMTYDDPDSRGPTASLPYVKKVYSFIRDKIPAEKLSLGIPFYYWGWAVSPQKRIKTEGTYDQLMLTKASYTYTEGFSSLYQVPFVTYYNNGKKYIIWHEDDQSFKIKLDFAKGNGLRGFSAWVLGLEDPKSWDVLN